MIWMGIYMLVLLSLEIFKRQMLFINLSLVVIAGFCLSLNFLNVDHLIVSNNTERSMRGEPFDAGYLAGLSSDAVPAMVDQFTNDALSADLHEGIGAALVCFQHMPSNQSLGERSWQSFHFSDRAALIALQRVSGYLTTYQVDDENWPINVTSPGGIRYSCAGDVGSD